MDKVENYEIKKFKFKLKIKFMEKINLKKNLSLEVSIWRILIISNLYYFFCILTKQLKEPIAHRTVYQRKERSLIKLQRKNAKKYKPHKKISNENQLREKKTSVT